MIYEVSSKKPPEWDGLVEPVREFVDPSKPLSGQVGAAIVAAQIICNQLQDPERFDANRYYGLGKVTCFVMQQLVTGDKDMVDLEDQLAQSVKQKYSDHSRWHGWPTGQGLRVGDLSLRIGAPIKVAGDIYEARADMAERVVNNVLSNPCTYESTQEMQRLSPVLAHASLVEDWPLAVVNNNLFAGTLISMRIALQRLNERKSGKECKDSWAGQERPIAEVMSVDDLEDGLPDLVKKLALHAASLHFNEITELPAFVLPDGLLDRQKRSNGVCLSPAQITVNHTERIGCPALFVPGSIPMFVEIAARGVAATQRELLLRDS